MGAEDLAQREQKEAEQAKASKEEMKAKLDTAQKDLEQKNKTAKELEEKVKNGEQAKIDATNSKTENKVLKQEFKKQSKLEPTKDAQAGSSSWVLNWDSDSDSKY